VVRRPLVLLGVTLALAIAPAAALGAPSDIASTRTYIQADYALVQAASARIPAARATFAGVLRRVKSECPGVAAGSPQDPESTELSNEVIGVMVTSAYHLDLPALSAFIRVAEHLHWSNRGLTSSVHSYAAKLKTLSVLSAPSLCADIKAWIASGFHSLPASNVAFAPRFMDAWVALGELPARLAPYERAEERGLLARTAQLENRLMNFEAGAVETWGEIMNELALNP
jgi:hypothetical protein